MKLLYIGPRYHTNQVPIMKGWMEHGDHVTFAAQFEGKSEVHDYVDFVKIKPSKMCLRRFRNIDERYDASTAEDKKIEAFVPSFIEMVKLLQQVKPDVVVLRDRKKTSFITYMACQLLGIKKVILYTQTSYEKLSQKDGFLKEFIKNVCFPRVVFTPVMYKGNRIKTPQNIPHVYFIPLVADVGERKKTYRNNNQLKLLDVGKYRDYKNHFYLIDAIEPLKDRDDISITIIGEVSNDAEKQYYAKLERKIMEKGLSHMVTLRKNINYHMMNTVYDEHDLLVLPSKNETAGMVILEAMAEGLGVISSNNCGLICYAEMNNSGKSFPLDNVTEVTDLIRRLADHNEIVAQWGSNARKTVEEKFQFKHYYAAFMGMIRDEFEEHKKESRVD